MKKILAAFNMSVCLLAFAAGLSAARADDPKRTAQLNIKMTVKQGCEVKAGSISQIDFGKFPNLDNPRWQSGKFTISCDQGYDGVKVINVSLDAGQRAGDSVSDRKLYNDAKGAENDALHYQVYIDRGQTKIWGDGKTGGTYLYPVNVNPAVSLDTVNEFFLELHKQDVSNLHTGTYSNTLTMQVDYSDGGN